MESSISTPLAKDRLLFVTGLPSKIGPLAILDYFSAMGRVLVMRLSKSQNGGPDLQPVTSSRDLRKGFCIIYAEDQQTFSKILGCRTLRFFGRSLSVIPFREGSDQHLSRERTRQALVIIKKVPCSMKEELLHMYVSTTFGEVKNIYRLQAESPQKEYHKLKNRKYHCYSVQFDSIDSAILATRVGNIYWKTKKEPMVIQRYKSFEDPKSIDQISQLSTHVKIGLRNDGNQEHFDLDSNCLPSQSPKDHTRPQIVADQIGRHAYMEEKGYFLPSLHAVSQYPPTQKRYFSLRNCSTGRESFTFASEEEANLRLNFISPLVLRNILH